jgi:predicted dehydrogenase
LTPRILIAGVGSIGRRHLRNLFSLGCRDILLFRSRPDAPEEFPNARVFTDLDKAIAEGPDTVLVCTPTSHHVPIALAAARAGCHLFIEKPLSHTWDGVEYLLEEVHGRVLTTLMGFDLRFDPGLRKIKELLAAHEIGEVVTAQVQVGQYLPDWHPWEDYRSTPSAKRSSGGGVVLDLVHELDYICWLLGPVAELSAMSGHVSSLEIETEDVAAILLRFETGAIATVQLDYLQRRPTRTCRLIGDSGTIEWDYFGSVVRWHVAGDDEWRRFEYPQFERNDRFISEMAHWLACLRGDERPVVDIDSGSCNLRLALAAKASSR